jgi:hypothetical protein
MSERGERIIRRSAKSLVAARSEARTAMSERSERIINRGVAGASCPPAAKRGRA